VSVALAGCNTVGSINRTGGVAVVEEETKEASGANISSLSEVIQRNPSDPAAYNTRGAAYARLARYSDAINDFNKAVQVDPNYAPAYANRALAFRQTNRNDAALADFSGAIAADPSYAPAYLGRANLLRVQGNFPGALDDLSQAIRLNPEAAEAFHARGLVHQRQGDHRAAILDFDAAIDRNPFVGAAGAPSLRLHARVLVRCKYRPKASRSMGIKPLMGVVQIGPFAPAERNIVDSV